MIYFAAGAGSGRAGQHSGEGRLQGAPPCSGGTLWTPRKQKPFAERGAAQAGLSVPSPCTRVCTSTRANSRRAKTLAIPHRTPHTDHVSHPQTPMSAGSGSVPGASGLQRGQSPGQQPWHAHCCHLALKIKWGSPPLLSTSFLCPQKPCAESPTVPRAACSPAQPQHVAIEGRTRDRRGRGGNFGVQLQTSPCKPRQDGSWPLPATATSRCPPSPASHPPFQCRSMFSYSRLSESSSSMPGTRL